MRLQPCFPVVVALSLVACSEGPVDWLSFQKTEPPLFTFRKLLPPEDDTALAALPPVDAKAAPTLVLGAQHTIALARIDEAGVWRRTSLELGPPDEATSRYVALGVHDFDGDGVQEVLHATGSVLTLLRESPAGELVVVTQLALPDLAETISAHAILPVDVDGDGDQEILIARNTDRAARSFVPYCRSIEPGGAVSCGVPDSVFEGATSVVVEIDQDALTVRPVPGVTDVSRQTYSVGAIDLDGDGREDLLFCDDAMPVRLLLQRAPGVFTDVSAAWGFVDRFNCMGITANDLNGDGRLDLAFASIGAPLFYLREANGFRRVTASVGLGKVAHWSWGIDAEDFDGDGHADVFTYGVVQPDAEWLAICSPCGLAGRPQPEFLLYLNDGAGRFKAVEPATAPPVVYRQGGAGGQARGFSSFDFDGNGTLDLLLLRPEENDTPVLFVPALLSNTSADSGLLVLAPLGSVVEACSGAACTSRRVMAVTQPHVARVESVHFAMPAGPTKLTVRVTWPDGVKTELGEHGPGRIVARR